MSESKNEIRIALILAVMVGVALLLPPQQAESWVVVGPPQDGGEWVYTEEAQRRTRAGDCGDPDDPASGRCLEMCYNFDDSPEPLPSGQFRCFYD